MIVHSEQKIIDTTLFCFQRFEFEKYPEPWAVFISQDYENLWHSFPRSRWYRGIESIQRSGKDYYVLPLWSVVAFRNWWWGTVSRPIARWLWKRGMLERTEGSVLPWHWPVSRVKLFNKKTS